MADLDLTCADPKNSYLTPITVGHLYQFCQTGLLLTKSFNYHIIATCITPLYTKNEQVGDPPKPPKKYTFSLTFVAPLRFQHSSPKATWAIEPALSKLSSSHLYDRYAYWHCHNGPRPHSSCRYRVESRFHPGSGWTFFGGHCVVPVLCVPVGGSYVSLKGRVRWVEVLPLYRTFEQKVHFLATFGDICLKSGVQHISLR